MVCALNKVKLELRAQPESNFVETWRAYLLSDETFVSRMLDLAFIFPTLHDMKIIAVLGLIYT